MNHAAQFALFLTALVLLVLPLTPTLREWLKPTDNLPLQVDQNATHHLRHFADSLRTMMDDILGEDPSAADLDLVTRGSQMQTQFIILKEESSAANAPSNASLEAIGKLGQIVVFTEDGKIAPNCDTLADIYALKDMTVGRRVSMRSCCVKGDMHIAPDVLVHRWIDAKNIIADKNLTVHGRITALESIRFSDDTLFARAGAPVMTFGEAQNTDDAVPARSLPKQAPSSRRFLFDGDQTISAAMACDGNFIVRGSVQIDAGTRIGGSIKAHDFLRTRDNVDVAGGLIAGRGIVIGAGSNILGPLIGDDDIILGPNCVIGTPDAPTTIVCRKLIVAQGVVIHGVITTQENAHVVFKEIQLAI